ncbi:CdaR family protein [bacterium]|nr:CdaR family protein [bacterium]
MAFLEDYKLKIVVLLFAIVIWFMVVTENDYDQVIDVSIALVNTPPGKVILNEVPRNAKVRIKGSGKSLIALGVSRGARLELDLSGIEDRKTFQLTPNYVNLARPAGAVSVEEILTLDTITVTLDDFQTKRIAVHTRESLNPADGYTRVGQVRLTPDSVSISGPKSLVDKIDTVHSEPIEASDLRFDFEESVNLASLPFEGVTADRNQVNVFLSIQMLVERDMNGIPVQIRNAPRNMKVNVVPSTLSLVLEGGGELLAQLERDDVVAYIDYNRVRFSPGKEIPAAIDGPSGVSYRDVRPKTFKLVFERIN